MDHIELSLVIPTYNERENIGILLARAHKILKEAGYSSRFIVVDDDSPDRTWEAAQALVPEHPDSELSVA